MSKTPRTEVLRADHGRRWGYIDHIGYGEMSRLAFDLERESAALRAVAKDAKDALIDNNWDRIAARHLIARIDAALGECHSQGSGQPTRAQDARRLLDYIADAIDGMSEDYRDSPNALSAIRKAVKFVRSTEINLPEPHMEGTQQK